MNARTSLKLTSSLILTGALALVVGACSPYDPALGDRPFRCGTSEPRCPDDYQCIEHDTATHLCEKTSAANLPDGGADADPSIDSGNFSCANDTELEPNNTITEATITPIPDFGDNYELINLAICPDTDKDNFRFRIDTAGKNVRVDLSYNSSFGSLNMAVLNGSGDAIKNGAALPGDPDTIRAEVPNLPTGTFYVEVSAPAGIQNNYSINIITSGP